MRCKHDFGWLSKKDVHIFVHPSGKATINWQGKNRLTFRVRMRCNYTECNAERNAYFTLERVYYGRIRNNPSKRGG
jgi:hypothetical protein